jgi:hypothetical protein
MRWHVYCLQYRKEIDRKKTIMYLKSTLTRKRHTTLIQRIAVLQRESDGDAIELLAKSDGLLITALGGVAHQKVVHATRQFDFDGGLTALMDGAQAAGYKVL